MRWSLVFWSFIVLAFQMSNAARILFVTPFFGKSHTIFLQSLGLDLANKGHNLTVITFNMIKDPPDNYKQIKVDQNPMMDDIEKIDFEERRATTIFQQLLLSWSFALILMPTTMETKGVQELINGDEEFDLVLCENFYQEVSYMFAHKFKAPLALIGTTTLQHHTSDFMGNPLPLNYAYHEYFKGNWDSWYSLMYNAVYNVYDRMWRKLYYMPRVNALAQRYFGHLGDLPKIEDLQKNVSLVLLNTHFSYDQVIPMVPGIVQIGGAHLKGEKPLPKDIKKFLDEATDGVIFFVLGTHLKSSQFKRDQIDSFLYTFSRLKQKVIWKWEDNNPPKAENIMFKKWLPQFDILAHPNVKLFINHGGMLSLQEALYHAVPMLGIPVFADQYRNIRRLTELKIGGELSLEKINNKEVVYETITKILEDGDYMENMKKVAVRFRDRPIAPLDEANYWIEHVIRNKDPWALKSPMAHMSFLQYYQIEIVLFLVLLFELMMIQYNYRAFLRLVAYCRQKKDIGGVKKVEKKTEQKKTERKTKQKKN